VLADGELFYGSAIGHMSMVRAEVSWRAVASPFAPGLVVDGDLFEGLAARLRRMYSRMLVLGDKSSPITQGTVLLVLRYLR
jgi:hypothetical protein